MYQLLIADDESEIRNGLANYFPWNKIGFEIAGTVENGFEAMEFIRHNQVDAALCDIRMPVMSGLDLARELHERRIPVKLVVLSGYREFDYARQALEFGVCNYILKPTKYAEIVRVFSEIRKKLDQEDAEYIFAEKQNQQGFNLHGEIIETVQSYISRNYQNATLEDAARMVYMNPFYLSKLFKQKTGVNFSDYLMQIKMEKAGELLKNMAYKVHDVSLLVGYSNPKNFTRAFKNYYKKSPNEFRKFGGVIPVTRHTEDYNEN